MSKSMNKVILLGNIGQDPVIRTFGSDKVATFSVATSTGGYKKQDGTEVPEKVLWHNISAWRGLAEIIEKYVHKGDKVCVTGSLSYNVSEQNGVKRVFTEIQATDIVLLGGKQPDNAQQPSAQAQAIAAAMPNSPQDGGSQSGAGGSQSNAQPDPFAAAPPKDDLPF